MRKVMMVVVAGAVLHVSNVGHAQTPQQPNEVSWIDTNGSGWRTTEAPVFLGGVYYYRSGPTVFFDGSVMVQRGTFKGVPIYVDATHEPNNVVYVPIAGKLMRPYERRRTDVSAEIVAVPAVEFPIAPDAESPRLSLAPKPGNARPSATSRQEGERVMTTIESIPRPRVNRGIWIEFAGQVWLASGSQGMYRPAAFTQIGSYYGFPVYQDSAHPAEIYLPSVPEGPLARYSLSTENTVR